MKGDSSSGTEHRGDRLPDSITETGYNPIWDLRHTLLRIKAQEGLPYLLSRWAELSGAAKMHLIDLLTRDELVANNKEIKQIVSAETSLPVRTCIVKKVCFTQDPSFIDILSSYRDTTDPMKHQIDAFFAKIGKGTRTAKSERISGMSSNNSPMGVDAPKVFFAYAAKRKDLVLELARHVESENGVKTVFMDEETHKGRTLTEKFEEVATQCGFGVFVLTADEQCSNAKTRSSTQMQIFRRSRQNVILELGYFWGRSGRRQRIAVLAEKGIDIPSDVLGMGVIWITSDLGKTKLELSSEIRQAGIGH